MTLAAALFRLIKKENQFSIANHKMSLNRNLNILHYTLLFHQVSNKETAATEVRSTSSFYGQSPVPETAIGYADAVIETRNQPRSN